MEDMREPIFQSSHNQDKIYFHKDMQQSDKDKFLKVIVKEINVNMEQKHWKMVPHSKVP